MKAWVLQGVDDLRWETVEEPILAKGEVLLQVKAAGICGSDIPRIYRTGAHVHPLIPGHEFSGLVVRTGPGVDPAWQGRRAGVFPLIPCRECLPCRKGQFEMCQNYGYLGSRRDGGFGEYAAVPAWNLIPLPEQVSYEEAAMLEPLWYSPSTGRGWWAATGRPIRGYSTLHISPASRTCISAPPRISGSCRTC